MRSWLDSEAALDVFHQAARRLRDLRKEDIIEEEILEEGFSERDKAQRTIDGIKGGLDIKKPWKQLEFDVAASKTMKTKAMQQFQDPGMTDLSSAIKTYLRSSKVRKLLSDLETKADGVTIVDPKEMRRLSCGLLKILMARSGNRPQVYGPAFTQAHFVSACNAGEAANPYAAFDPRRHSKDGERHLVDGGATVYVRKNPHGRDPLDKADHMDSQHWEILKGRCVEVISRRKHF